MLNTKFLDILKSLSKDEIRLFRDFIRSPFHNTNKNVARLSEIIRKYGPGYESAAIEKENLFQKIYPGKKYNDTVMRILLSDLLTCAEEFLVLTHLKKDKFRQEQMLLEELKNRKLDSLFRKHVKEAEKILSGGGVTIDGFFLDRYKLDSIKVDYLIARDRQDESGSDLISKSENLITFALINILNIVQELSEHEEVLNRKMDFNLAGEMLRRLDLDELVQYVKRLDYKYYPVIEVYYFMYKTIHEKYNERCYGLLKDSIEKNLHLFHPDEQFNLFLILESCCLSHMRNGFMKGHEELFVIYEMMLKNETFSMGRDYMQANLFRNMFYTAIVLRKFGWAEKFAEKHSVYLLPAQRADMLNYTKAILEFERNNFESALENITKVNYTFFVFKFEAKVLMLKIYYEMRLFDAAESLIDSFSHFLSKNKIVSSIYREQFMNFLRFLKALIRCTNSGKPGIRTELHDLKKKIEQTPSVINKRWLLEKAGE